MELQRRMRWKYKEEGHGSTKKKDMEVQRRMRWKYKKERHGRTKKKEMDASREKIKIQRRKR